MSHLQIVHEPVHLSGLEHGEHGLADVERVPPVVVLHRPVVLLHAQDPPTQILKVNIPGMAQPHLCLVTWLTL